MQRTWRVMLAILGASTVLAGCGSAASTRSRLPADSPLTDCVDPTPATPKPLDTAVAQNFADGRVHTALSLDNGTFRAVPALSDAAPKISAALAFCNLLAGVTTNNFPVIVAADQHGLSFGLGVVTVADSVLKTGPRTYLVGSVQQTDTLQPYHARLSWIAVIKPDVATSCPGAPSNPSPQPTPSRQQALPLPAYQILAVDADTGADGIIYSAKTNNLCGEPGYQPASVAPAAEIVSVPWTLVKRGPPGSETATITYQARPCDARDLPRDIGTGKPVVSADRTNPSLVAVTLERTITACGPAVPVPVLLRGYTPATDLPQHLVHAPTGARDVPADGAG